MPCASWSQTCALKFCSLREGLKIEGLGGSQHLEIEPPAEMLSSVQSAGGPIPNGGLQRIRVRRCGFKSDGVLSRDSSRGPGSGADPQAQEGKSVWIESHYQTLQIGRAHV